MYKNIFCFIVLFSLKNALNIAHLEATLIYDISDLNLKCCQWNMHTETTLQILVWKMLQKVWTNSFCFQWLHFFFKTNARIKCKVGQKVDFLFRNMTTFSQQTTLRHLQDGRHYELAINCLFRFNQEPEGFHQRMFYPLKYQSCKLFCTINDLTRISDWQLR